MNENYEKYTDEQIQEWSKEDLGNIPDGFLLSQEEVNELKKSKKELADYSRQKFKEMIESKNKRNSK